MKINYNILDQSYSYELLDNKSNFVLVDNLGNYLNLGIKYNFDKYQGYFILREDLKLFKIIDEFKIFNINININSIDYNGFTLKRNFEHNSKQYYDKFYLSNKKVITYESNFNEEIFLDLDIRERDDYSTENRNYDFYFENDILIIEYKKNNIFLGLTGTNFEQIKQWINKKYEYSKERNSIYDLYVFRALKFKLNNSKIYLSAGFSKEEIIENLNNQKNNYNDIYLNDRFRTEKLFKEIKNNLKNNIKVTYEISKNSMNKFITPQGAYAGFGWFSNIWTRDELISLNYFIQNKNYTYVKKTLNKYLKQINNKTGLLKRLNINGSLESCDGIFWLSKRYNDLFKSLENDLDKYFSKIELINIYNKLKNSFDKIFSNQFEELLKVKKGDSWMDTIEVENPLDMQILFLSFIKNLAELAELIEEDNYFFLELECEFNSYLRKKYFRNSLLYDEINTDRLTSNVFLIYYIYPDLLSKKEWNIVFDNSLEKLKTTWGAISSLNREDNNFHQNYSGENNQSYHNGDSWHFMNSITAICLNKIDKIKYKKEINDIINLLNKDILQLGTIGFCSEISSSNKQKAQGNLAQLWSSALYCEMINELFKN